LIAWAHLYRQASTNWQGLYDKAPLDFAEGIVMQVVPGDVISDSIAFNGVWELSLSRRVTKAAKVGGLMVDVGANLGYFSLLWAAARPDNRVLSFEASPRNVAFFQHNATLNNLESQIQVHSVAIGKEAGPSQFDLRSLEQTGWGGFATRNPSYPIIVDVIRLDDILDTTAEVSLLKIDIEGADTWALMGCEELLRRRQIKSIWFEQNKTRMKHLGIGLNEAEAFLKSIGYECRPESDPSQDVVDWSAWPR
jgi:FkbM family methyltransferase